MRKLVKAAVRVKKRLVVAIVLGSFALAAIPAGARAPGTNGRIAFMQPDPATEDDAFVFTMNPDGSNREQLVPAHACCPSWSLDGGKISIGGALGADGRITTATVNPDGTDYDVKTIPDPTLNLECPAWSPDGDRFICEGWDDVHPDRAAGLFSVGTSDFGGLVRLTTSPNGGHDVPGTYSPDGKRVVFIRSSEILEALFVVKINGGGLRQITRSSMILNFEGGNWSPQGNEILFSAHVDSSHRGSIWVVHSNGSGLRRIPIDACGGSFTDPDSFGCFQPSWSPDGKKIVFTRFSAAAGHQDIYTVNANGTGLSQVTNTPDVDEENADWGTHPVTP